MVCVLCAAPSLGFAQEHELAESRLQVGLDFVLGLGQRMKEELAGEAFEAPKPPMVESFLLAARYEVAEHFAVGARFGLSIGDGAASRELEKTTTAFSNVELEGEYETELDEHTGLALSLGVSLPTAQGLISEDATGRALASGARRLAAQEAVAAARGFEDGALFEPGYFGLIPKIALDHHAGALVLEAFAKYESLVRVAGGDETSYVGELIPGGFIGYELAKLVTLGVGAWGNVAFQAPKESAFVIEPQARAALGPVRLALGALVPLVSRFEHPTLSGLRLMAAARF
jgi:hypothetical protein